MSSIDKDSPSVTAEVSVLFINKNLAQEQVKTTQATQATQPITRSSEKKNTAKSKINVAASGHYSPLKRSSSPKKRTLKASGSSPKVKNKSMLRKLMRIVEFRMVNLAIRKKKSNLRLIYRNW